jgi:iron complex transport system ATP-binding protein
MSPAKATEAEDSIRPIRAFALALAAVRVLSPSFRRITFTGPELDLFGTGPGGATLVLRVKVMIPSPGHQLPGLFSANGSLPEDWYRQWRALDDSSRGFMRSYTVRALRPGVAATAGSAAVPAELDLDFVLHGVPPAAAVGAAGTEGDGGTQGPASCMGGPAANWASSARVGDPLLVIGPCARWGDCVGIEFAPGEAERVLLVGDETAVPAIAAILEALPAHIGGHAVLEVPASSDFLDIGTSSAVEVRWHARNSRAHGEALAADVRRVIAPAACRRGEEPEDVDVDAAILWETPAAMPGHGLYAWIAGEAAGVRALRRYLVRDVGMDRNAVAFMGYWRRGQALPG